MNPKAGNLSVRDRFLLFDPAYLNMRNAIRGTLAVVASYFVFASLARSFHAAPTLPFLAVLMALLSAIVVSDNTLKDQKISTALLIIPAFAAASLSVLLHDYPFARLAVFLIVTFIAVSIRRFGVRYVGLGTMAFMSYFATLFFPFGKTEIPFMIAAILGSIAFAYIARFYLLPDKAHVLLTLYTKAFDLQTLVILEKLAKALRSSAKDKPLDRGDDPSSSWKDIRKAFIQINELSLNIEQFFDANENSSIRSKSDSFRLKTFEQEVALRRIWDYAFEFLHSDTMREEKMMTASDLLLALKAKQNNSDIEKLTSKLALIDEECRSFATAVKDAQKIFQQQEFNAADIVTAVEEIETKTKTQFSELSPKRKRKGMILSRIDSLHANTRQAVQATLATALASMLGTTISPERWYWASIAAFSVFIGATRGETMMRAVLRILGTVLGLILGFALAFATSGYPGLEWTLIVFCVFFGIFAARLTFGFWTASLFSSMFALFYDILGLLNRNILILRIEETLIGAVIGVIVAAIVLPTSTHTVIRQTMADYLRTLAQLLSTLPTQDPNVFSRRSLIRNLRAMDKDLLAYRIATLPILSRGSLMKEGELRSAVHDATMLAHYVRHLAIHVDPRSEMSEKEFEEACLALSAQFEEISTLVRDGKRREREKLPWSGKPSRNMNGPKHSIERIRVALASIAARKI